MEIQPTYFLIFLLFSFYSIIYVLEANINILKIVLQLDAQLSKL